LLKIIKKNLRMTEQDVYVKKEMFISQNSDKRVEQCYEFDPKKVSFVLTQ